MTDLTPNEREWIKIVKPDLKPHPDGQPWNKCCSKSTDTDHFCQCFARKPSKNHSRMWKLLTDYVKHFRDRDVLKRMWKAQERFFCVHRTTEDGYYRECAGWAILKHKGKVRS